MRLLKTLVTQSCLGTIARLHKLNILIIMVCLITSFIKACRILNSTVRVLNFVVKFFVG